MTNGVVTQLPRRGSRRSVLAALLMEVIAGREDRAYELTRLLVRVVRLSESARTAAQEHGGRG